MDRSQAASRAWHCVWLFVALAGVWLLLSGHYDALFLAFGAVSCIFALTLAWRFDVIDRESHPLHLWWRLPGYWLWLLVEIARANIDVARRILAPDLPIDPRVFRVRCSADSDLGHAIYANSITLTPGTISLDVQRDSVLVHALTAEGMAALESGEMDARVAAL